LGWIPVSGRKADDDDDRTHQDQDPGVWPGTVREGLEESGDSYNRKSDSGDEILPYSERKGDKVGERAIWMN